MPPAAAHRQPIDIARLEETRLANAVARIAAERAPWCGGYLCCDTPGSWANFAAGFDFVRTYTDADVDQLTDFYTARGVEPRLEVAPFVDASLTDRLAQRGFTLRQFEAVFACELHRRTAHAEPFTATPGLRIETVDTTDDDQLRLFALTATRGFLAPGDPEDLHVPLAMKGARLPGVINLIAYLGSAPVGAASMELAGELATFYGVTVDTTYRRCGIQRALIEHRLDLAAEHGIAIATVSSKPGIATERNALRAGFTPCYTKVHLALAGEGLAASRI